MFIPIRDKWDLPEHEEPREREEFQELQEQLAKADLKECL